MGLWLVTGGRALDAARARVGTAAAAGLTACWPSPWRSPDPTSTWPGCPSSGCAGRSASTASPCPSCCSPPLIGVLVAAHAWVDVPEGGTPATFLGCLLIVEAGALATFTARDAVLFFVAFELVLVPMWVLISRFGDRHDERARADAGHRFILYTAVGSTLMLVGILALVTSAGTSDLRAARRRGRCRAAGRPAAARRGAARARAVGEGAGLPAAHLAAAGPHHRARPPGRCCWPPCC